MNGEANGLTLKQYTFPTKPIPRLNCHDSEALKLISESKPVVLTDTDLVTSALCWDLKYLEDYLGNDKYTVFESPTQKFKFFNDAKLKENSIGSVQFAPPMEKLELTFSEFASRLRHWKVGNKRLYLQQPLNDTVGTNIVHDFQKFNWNWISTVAQENNWGPLTSNMLFVASGGNITPAHYDEQENMFGQIRGFKRFVLFPPEQFSSFYPHPVWHPHDRQSQVDFDNPDFEKFPKFGDAFGQEAVIGPGDVLYIPTYWWHHVESLQDNHDYTVSVNFWYKANQPEKIVYPLVGHQKVSIMRNIEKMLVEALKDVDEVGELLKTIVLGRYT